ncbi:hypothetical protein LOAG_18185 [Loa loa]|uniref:Uncharacterized protein n=2 Tax=Loa loa TaxID=7209 RepID=A0A1S0UI58_LOALO|nr:hypothetical protein LOAG_18185 [Loa loa]EJD74504.1 hypothetical protein LOAG_18185 [Loa loa]
MKIQQRGLALVDQKRHGKTHGFNSLTVFICSSSNPKISVVDSKIGIFLEFRKLLLIVGPITAGEVFVFFVAYQLCSQLMATARSMGQALYSVVYVTVPNSTVAQQIAREVVKGKYAACVNIIPTITSIYEWENKLEEDKESLLIMKTKSSVLDALKAKVLSMHPYKVPEFIALPIESGSESYLQWIDKQVNS